MREQRERSEVRGVLRFRLHKRQSYAHAGREAVARAKGKAQLQSGLPESRADGEHSTFRAIDSGEGGSRWDCAVVQSVVLYLVEGICVCTVER